MDSTSPPSAHQRTASARLNTLRIVVTVVLLALLVYLVNWQELASTMRGMNFWWFAAAVAVYGLGPLFMAQRWGVLLAAQQVDLNWWELLKLTYLGLFWNLFLPGGTGGDLVKAYYLTKHTHRKAEGATTVFVDRVVGLFIMIVIAWIATLFHLDDPQIGGLSAVLGGILLCLVLGAGFYFSRRLRGLIRIEKWPLIRRGGLLAKIDHALFIYRQRPRGILSVALLTLCGQIAGYTSFICCGLALELPTTIPQYVFLVPIGIMLSALPISIFGIGLAELTFAGLFAAMGQASDTQGVALAILGTKAIPIIWAIPGLFISLTGKHLPAPMVMRRELETSAE